MADSNSSEKSTTPQAIKAAKKRQQIKEVKQKLSRLSPGAAAEAVEEVVASQARKQVSGFGEFVRDQGVIGIGVGLVLGIQVKAVVDTIMASFVNPLTELLLPGKQALSAQSVFLTIGDKGVGIGWGAIVYSIFTFFMVAIIVYAGYKLLKLDKLSKKKEEKPEPPKEKPKK